VKPFLKQFPHAAKLRAEGNTFPPSAIYRKSSPSRENVLTTPKFSTEVPEKSPSTISGVAFSIASA
jgi:hypothetical protein